MFPWRLGGKVEPTTSGHGSIDLIVPGCHKASGLKRLAERWGISPEQCAAFGDGGNDIEMLNYCGYSYAMENAPDFCLNNIRRILMRSGFFLFFQAYQIMLIPNIDMRIQTDSPVMAFI